MKWEEAFSAETSVNIDESTRRHIPEDLDFQQLRCEEL
jgi:hypothetical protein